MATAYQRLGQDEGADAPLLSRLDIDIDESQSLGLHNRHREKYHPVRPGRWWYAKFFGLAVLTGIILQAVLWSLAGSSSGDANASVANVSAVESCEPTSPVVVSTTSTTWNATQDKAEEDRWPLEKVREMVGRTKGYYARDYSLNLGWNNVSLTLNRP